MVSRPRHGRPTGRAVAVVAAVRAAAPSLPPSRRRRDWRPRVAPSIPRPSASWSRGLAIGWATFGSMPTPRRPRWHGGAGPRRTLRGAMWCSRRVVTSPGVPPGVSSWPTSWPTSSSNGVQHRSPPGKIPPPEHPRPRPKGRPVRSPRAVAPCYPAWAACPVSNSRTHTALVPGGSRWWSVARR